MGALMAILGYAIGITGALIVFAGVTLCNLSDYIYNKNHRKTEN